MGQVIMVTCAGQTLQSQVTQALAAIESCPVKLMVLNQLSPSRLGRYVYGQGYAYGYGYAHKSKRAHDS
jgi:protein-tyrosine kinase